MTVDEVFELALDLMDEDDDGEYYRARAVKLVRVLRSEIARVMMWRHGYGALETLSDEVGLSDELCESVLAYGLAAQLLLEEDPARASFFEGKYEEELAKAVRRTPGVFEEIANIYGEFAAA